MTALKPDDVTVSPVGGGVLTEVAIDVTTLLGVYVQLRGAAVTSTSVEAVITRGATSVTLTATAASGEVTAPLTAANLTTLGASIGDVLTGWIQGTVTDGSGSQTWRYQMSIRVSDRVWRFPFDYNRFTTRLMQFGKTCSIPSGQTNWWPQICLGLEDLRNDINRQRSDVKTAFLSTPGALTEVAEVYGTESALRTAVSHSNAPQGSTLIRELMRWEKRRETILAETIVSMRDNSAWKTEGSREERAVVPARTWAGRGQGVGGPL